MNYDYVLKNGVVVDPHNGVHKKLDIAIQDGKIAALEEEIDNGKTIIDLNGKYVIPGVIDIHTHMTRVLGGPLGYKMMAATGVTTAIDFAGPVIDIKEKLNTMGSGLNVGCLQGLIPDLTGVIETNNPSSSELQTLLDKSLEDGALGFKLMGGHYPLTPEATEEAMRVANNNHAFVAFHAGTTASKSDMTGMREAIELAKGKKLLLAHINAYCRGIGDHPFIELQEALQLVKDNPNVYSESHLALINGTSGYCENGAPKSDVTKMCLKRFGFAESEEGLKEAIEAGVARVHKEKGGQNILVYGQEGIIFWREQGTSTGVSFPANLPTIAVACAVERVRPGGDFIIDIQSTDGGGIPRNNLISRLLSLVKLEYLTLNEVIVKISLNPAKMFGLANKGHLGKGADADITILDQEQNKSVMSFVNGKLTMKDGIVLQEKGTMIVTEAGIQAAKDMDLGYQVVDLKQSTLYQD